MKKAIILFLVTGGLSLLTAIIMIWAYQVKIDEIIVDPELTPVVRTETFPFSDQTHLILELCAANLEIIPDPNLTNTLVIEENSGYFQPRNLDSKLVQTLGKEIKVSNCKAYHSQGPSWFGTVESEVSLKLHVPVNQSWEKIEIASSFNSQITGHLTAQHITLENRYGNTNTDLLTLDTAELLIDNGSSYLTLDSLKAPRLIIENGSGVVEIEKINSDELIISNSGQLKIQEAIITQTTNAHCDRYGDLEFSKIKTTNFNLENENCSVIITDSTAKFLIDNDDSGRVELKRCQVLTGSQVSEDAYNRVTIDSQSTGQLTRLVPATNFID